MKHKKLSIILLTLIIGILSVVSLVSAEWPTNNQNLNREGFFAGGTGLFVGTLSVSSISEGSQFQPLITDLDGDGIRELVTTNSNTLNIYSSDGNSIVAQAVLVYSGTQSTTLTVIEDFDTDAFVEFLVVMGNNATVLEYNGTGINIETSAIIPTPATGSVCKNLTHSGNNILCYWGNRFGTNVTEFNPVTGAFTVFNLNATNTANVFASVSGGEVVPLPITDGFGGNVDRIAMLADWSAEGQQGILLIQVPSPSLVTTFSGDGIIDNIGTAIGGSVVNSFMNSMMFTPLTAPGESSIQRLIINLVVEVSTGNSNAQIIAFTSSGTEFWNADMSSQNYNATSGIATGDLRHNLSSLAVQDIDGDGDFDVCNVFTTSSAVFVFCVNPDGTTSLLGRNSLFGDTEIITERSNIAMADIDADGQFEIITGGAIIDRVGFNSIDFFNYSDSFVVNGNTSIGVADIDGDNLLDVCGSRPGNTFCVFSDNFNRNPILNQSFEFGGYGATLGFTTPVCVNTTQTFVAQECGGTGIGAPTCNYDNDILTDRERIVSNCGFGSLGNPITNDLDNLLNGTFEGSRPQFSCFYNQTGTFTISLFLQDTANTDNLTEKNIQPIIQTVIVGQPGVDCNIGSNTNPGSAGSVLLLKNDQIDTAFDETLGLLFGASPRIRLMFGFGILLLIIVGMAVASNGSPFAIATGAVVGLFMMTFIGLIPLFVVLLVMFALILIFILLRVIMVPRAGGE